MVEYVAVDIGKRNRVLCAENKNGTIDELFNYPNTTSDAITVAKGVIAKYGECMGVVDSFPQDIQRPRQEELSWTTWSFSE